MTKSTCMSSDDEDEVVFGPHQSFYSEDDDDASFRILREEDGLFFEFRNKNGEQIAGATLVGPNLEDLIKILKKEKKRLKKNGEY